MCDGLLLRSGPSTRLETVAPLLGCKDSPKLANQCGPSAATTTVPCFPVVNPTNVWSSDLCVIHIPQE